jgi:hypothetical protein
MLEAVNGAKRDHFELVADQRRSSTPIATYVALMADSPKKFIRRGSSPIWGKSRLPPVPTENGSFAAKETLGISDTSSGNGTCGIGLLLIRSTKEHGAHRSIGPPILALLACD